MKKKIIWFSLATLLCCVSTISFCQNGSNTPCSEFPQLSTPKTAINDFAGIMSGSTKQKMENNLTLYEDSTKIAIVVATIQTLNGKDHDEYATDLFRCWGIGDKATNSGVLVLVAMDEHKLVIRTGYGLEGILPDITSKPIIDDYMTPLFKEEKYSEGVEAGVNRIIEILGTMSWEERQERLNAKQLAEERRAAEIKENLLHIALGVLLVILLFFLGRIIAKNIEKNKLRKKISGFVEKIRLEIVKAQTAITTSMETYKDAPSWAKSEAQNHQKEAYKALTEAQKTLVEAEESKKENPVQSMGLIEVAHQLIEKSFKNFSKIDIGLREKIKKFATEAPVRLASAKEQVLKSLEFLNGYTQKGYKLAQVISEHENFRKILEEYEAQIGDNELHQRVYTQAGIITTKSAEAIDAVSVMLQKQKEISAKIDPLIGQGKKQYDSATKVLDLFKGYKENYPESVWQSEEMLLKKLIGKLDSQRLDKLRNEIVQLNSMEKQEFTTAAMKYDELERQVNDIQQLCAKVQDIAVEQQKSKKMFAGTYASADQLVQKALQKVKNSDVESSTRTLAKNAQQKLQEAKIQSSASILDWVLLIMLINSVADLANDSIRKAESDIDDAERKRRREREEAAEAAAKKKRDDDAYKSYSPTTYISSYSSPSSTPSFGGFGGGGTGGGGASGGW